LSSIQGLIAWFLVQEGNINGYTHAIFSGLPTCELARVIRDFVLPRTELKGVYHVAAQPISKYELLKLVNQEYGKRLKIEPYDQIKIDRSLNATRFQEVTGYVAPAWPDLIAKMREFG
jgi:dTDP-4-dehydrorhamnose reductase